jgi:hypothetical protein
MGYLKENILVSAPLSIWHVMLGWMDVTTDIVSVACTMVVYKALKPLCGLDLQPYFLLFFYIQLFLLLGNLCAQVGAAMAIASAPNS